MYYVADHARFDKAWLTVYDNIQIYNDRSVTYIYISLICNTRVFNVVDAYTYKNYIDAITWLFIRLNNACQCLGARITHFVSIKVPLVIMMHGT